MMTPASPDFIRRLRKVIADCFLLRALPTTTCAICTDDFICRDELIRLPNCHHFFHRKCILPWFSRNNTCPICRHVFPTDQPKLHTVRLRSHCHFPSIKAMEHDHVFLLRFHLRPLRSSSSESLWPWPLTDPLKEMLVIEGYHELLPRACGPYWVHVERIDEPSSSSSGSN